MNFQKDECLFAKQEDKNTRLGNSGTGTTLRKLLDTGKIFPVKHSFKVDIMLLCFRVGQGDVWQGDVWRPLSFYSYSLRSTQWYAS